MVQYDLHRLHVLTLLESGKIKDAKWFLWSLLAIVQGCGRKLFFACSGNGNGTSWNNRGSNGNYWSASFNSARNARNLNFNSGGVNPQNNNNRYNGFAVRPVQLTVLIILFLLFFYGTYKATASTRPLSSVLRCENKQECEVLCSLLGKESQKEYGRTLRGFVFAELQTPSIEMFHCGLSQKARDIRCNVQRQNSTSLVFQLYASAIRKDFYSGHVQLHQESWYSLWNSENYGFLQEGKSQLAKSVLCDAPRYKGLLYAHREETAFGNSYWKFEKNGNSRYIEIRRYYVGRSFGYGLCNMAYGSYRYAESKGELCHLWRQVRLGWFRPCKEYAALGRWSWITNRQFDKSAILERLPECFRPVHEARNEMPLLWSLCGRCGSSEFRQRMASELSSKNNRFPSRKLRIGIAQRKIGDFGGTQRNRVLGSVHQALANIHIESFTGENEEKDFGVRFLKTLEDCPFHQFVFRYIPTHQIIQSLQETIPKERYFENWSVQSRSNEVYR